jgi:hypothetical protein
MVKDYSFPIIDKTVIFVDLHCEKQMEYHQRIHTAVALCISALECHCAVTLAWYDRELQAVQERHLEQDEDLFESVGMLTAACYCQALSPDMTLEQLNLVCQLEQLIYITGELAEGSLEKLEQVDFAKRIWVYSIGQCAFGVKEFSEKVTCHMLDRKCLEQNLECMQVELY